LVEKMIEKTKTEKGWCHLIHCAFCSCGTWCSWSYLLFTSLQTSICHSRCWVTRGHSVRETWNQVRKLPDNQFPLQVTGMTCHSPWTTCVWSGHNLSHSRNAVQATLPGGVGATLPMTGREAVLVFLSITGNRQFSYSCLKILLPRKLVLKSVAQSSLFG
jgi:hypothetical protein